MDVLNKTSLLSITFPQTPDECTLAASGFRSISSNDAIDTCVSVVDGYHLCIQTPSKKEAKNVRSFFSGHYQTYGVNVQSACDHHCRFTFMAVAGPGVMGDRNAIQYCPLHDLIEKLPGLYHVIGDCAYTATEHLIPIFGGVEATRLHNDSFNYFASQLRIRIEMAFGMMVQKWGILQRPLRVNLKNVKHVVLVIARLHNYCINERLRRSLPSFDPNAHLGFSVYEEGMRLLRANQENSLRLSEEFSYVSHNRIRLVQRIHAKGLQRPTNRLRRRSS